MSQSSITPVFEGDRGFAQMGSPLMTDYGHLLRIQESSAVRPDPMCWLFIDDESAFVPHEKGEVIGVHMTPSQVQGLRDRLTAWLARHEME